MGDMVYSAAVNVKVGYKLQPEHAGKVVVCGVSEKYALEAVKACGYSVDEFVPFTVFVAYGSWNPTSKPGLYKITRREDFGKYDVAQAKREWQLAARKKMEAEWASK